MTQCNILNRRLQFASEWPQVWELSYWLPEQGNDLHAECRNNDPSALGGISGQAEDLRIHAERIVKTRDKLNRF